MLKGEEREIEEEVEENSAIRKEDVWDFIARVKAITKKRRRLLHGRD